MSAIQFDVDFTKPLENSSEASLRGLAIRRMSNAKLGRGVAEGGPRYGDQWSRPSAHGSDRGWGFFYAEFAGTAEYLVVLQRNGDTTARLYSVSTAGTWTAIAENGSDALVASPWHFTQYDSYIYAQNKTAGVYRRRVGGNTGSNADDEWRLFEPEFVRSAGLVAETSRPPYSAHTWPGTTTLTGFSQSGSAFGLAESPGTLDSENRIYLRQTDDVNGLQKAYTYVVASISAALDLSRVDRLYFFLGEGVGEPKLIEDDSSHTGVWLVENASATITQPSHLSGFVKAPVVSVQVEQNEFYCMVDLSGIPRADRNAVRKIVFGFYFGFDVKGYVYLRDLTFGGVMLLGGVEEVPPIDYAYAFYNPTTGSLSAATLATVPAGEGEGSQIVSYVPKLGAWVELSPSSDSGLYGQGFTKIRVYRKETLVVTGRDRLWRYLGEVDNTGTPSWVDSLTEAELVLLNSAELSFDGFITTLEAQAIGVWKQSLLLALDRKAFMSGSGMPNRFLPPPEELDGQLRDDDLFAGRTLYVGQGQIDEVKAFVSQDLLYLLTDRGVYCMVGDQVADATPPRLLPGSRAVLGSRACCRWQTGIVVAASDGLWFYEASRAFAGSSDGSMRAEELTFSVRDSWAALMAESGEVLVLEHEDDVWVFKGSRFLKLTRNQPVGGRHWEEGSWAAVEAGSSHPTLGLRLLLANGRIVKTAGSYTTDNGTAVNWWVETGEMIGGRIQPTALAIEGVGEVTATFYWTDGRREPTEQSESFSGTEIWKKGFRMPGVSRWRVRFAGVVGSAAVHRVRIKAESLEDERT